MNNIETEIILNEIGKITDFVTQLSDRFGRIEDTLYNIAEYLKEFKYSDELSFRSKSSLPKFLEGAPDDAYLDKIEEEELKTAKEEFKNATNEMKNMLSSVNLTLNRFNCTYSSVEEDDIIEKFKKEK